jgi:hypothetical protein
MPISLDPQTFEGRAPPGRTYPAQVALFFKKELLINLCFEGGPSALPLLESST